MSYVISHLLRRLLRHTDVAHPHPMRALHARRPDAIGMLLVDAVGAAFPAFARHCLRTQPCGAH